MSYLAPITLTSCTAVTPRLWDLTDIVDVKYGLAAGVGGKVEISDYFGTGAAAGLAYFTREWYGRKRHIQPTAGGFVHLGAFGVEAYDRQFSYGGLYFLGFDLARLSVNRSMPPPLVDRWRFGGELLGGSHLGLYLNVGELADFFAGFFGADLADDDGVSKLELWNPPVRPPHERRTGRAKERETRD